MSVQQFDLEALQRDPVIISTREQIVEAGAILFQRNLTDLGGGNISVRVGDVILMTPSYAGARHHWKLKPENILICSEAGEVLAGDGVISREAEAHLRLQNEFRDYGSAMVHCHARNVMVFAALAKSMPMVLEATLKFGDAPITEYAPSHNSNLSEYVYQAMKGRESMMQKHAACVIMPWHGLFCFGKDLDLVLDAAERMDTNAYCLLMAGAAGMSAEMESARQNLVTSISKYK